jgi:hypothetical protein
MKSIIKLIEWQGGWASRFFYDNAVSRVLNSQAQDFKLAEMVAKSSCGHSAKRTFIKYEKMTGQKVDFDISVRTIEHKAILDLTLLKRDLQEYQTSFYWYGRLKEHLSSNDISSLISDLLINEVKPPKKNPIIFLKNWSFPIISELFPLKDNQKKIVFVESDLASLCWKRWHLNTELNPIWIDTSNRSQVGSSQFLIWRLIHEATHLLHLQNYPLAGDMTDPFWLAQMESVAMAAEYRFLNYVETEKDIPSLEGYQLNRKNIITILLFGFFERALRLEYELDIYADALQPDEWINEIKNKYDLNSLNMFDFAFEFHNMKGFMSSYLIGLNYYLNSKDEVQILNGTKRIFDEK